MKTVCFTGHRPDKLGGYDENNDITLYVKDMLLEEVAGAILEGYTRFIWGGALGVDTWAAESVLFFKDHADFEPILELFVPFEGQEKNWPKSSQERYNRLLKRSDKVVQVCEPGYAAWKMLKRDEAMVDAADVVIAVWNGDDKGGTAHTVKYAKKIGKPIIVIDPAKWSEK